MTEWKSGKMSRPDMIDSLPPEYKESLREILNLRIV
jgi:hypothetical protein